LRDSDLPTEEKTLERLVDEVLVITGAGTEKYGADGDKGHVLFEVCA
jgi:hypothetical protein